MSFGGEHENTEIAGCIERQTILLAAAGNKGNNDPVDFPAGHPAVISVGSLNTYSKVSEFSAENPVLISITVGNNWHFSHPNQKLLKFSMGTSIATPGIAGLVCLA